MLLTVRGRSSGRLHTVPLMSLPDGDDLLVVASQGGVDREPQWWLNLLVDPHAEVERRGERFAVVAEKVGDDERQALWDRFVGDLRRLHRLPGEGATPDRRRPAAATLTGRRRASRC